ncbi:MAG TPA: T9SS type A sorting domain-containing protein, partial [Bacteroidia bacterium]|nr:T9SS type A sorting domain-containing protein [Bacteroidia bacterium]
NADTIFVGGVNVWMSGDKGLTWTLMTQWYGSGAPYIHADQHHIVFVPGSSSSIYSACDGGIFKTTDKGNTWTDYSNNLEIGQIYSLGLSAITQGLSVSGWQDNGTSVSSPSWNQVYGGDGEVCFIDYTNDNDLFVSYQNGALYYSTDGGINFNSATNGITETGPWTTRWLQDPRTPTILYAGFVNVWQSIDMGVSWKQMSNWGTWNISALAVAPSNNKYIYAAQYDSIFLSTDAGLTWTSINGALPLKQVGVTDIAVDPYDPLKVWVTCSGYSTSNKVFRSVNGGVTWTNISTGLPNLPVNTIVYHPGSPEGVYVGTDFGVYYRDSILNKWVNYNTGLPNVVIDDLQIDSTDNTLVAGTFGRGEWQTQTYVSVGVKQLQATLNNVNVYPNPVNSKITISANMPKGDYTMNMLNVLGQSVYQNKISVSGHYIATVDVSGYSPGVYFLKIAGVNSSVEKKIVISR